MKKTVRIAAVIDATGQWHAVGYSDSRGAPMPDEELLDDAFDGSYGHVSNNCKKHIITVELELPEPDVQTVAGVVVGGAKES